MQIIYEGVDITDAVVVHACVVRDRASGGADGLDITFENAGAWFGWGPKEDDRLRVMMDGYDSGEMYAHTVEPESGRYRILATSLPCAARQKGSRSFTGLTPGDILLECAALTGMSSAVYGTDSGIPIPYIEQSCETPAAFLDRLFLWEGFALKCVNGRYTAISIPWAQERSPFASLRVTASQDGARYQRGGQKLRALTVSGPYGTAEATDSDVGESHPSLTVNGLPVRNAGQAARWARGLLLHINRATESLTLETEYNPAMTALCRVNVTGGTDADGAWLADEVTHDLMDRTTTVRLYRCLTGIA